MKNLLKTSIVGMSMVLSITASAHMKSELNLKMHDNGVFSVMLDGGIAGENVPSVSICNVHPGKHELKVMRYFVNPWCGMMVPKVIFNGCITVPPQSKVYSMISCNNCYQVVNVFPICGPQWGGGNCGNGYGGYGNNGGSWGNGNGYGNNGGWGDNDDGYYGDGQGGGHGYDPVGNNGWGGNGGNCGPMCMSPEMFGALKTTMQSKPFDHTKLEVAKQAMSMNYFSSAQVADLMALFDFDHDKLDFAKAAYTRTIDKQNYFMVSNGFTFSHSAEELSEYIKHI